MRHNRSSIAGLGQRAGWTAAACLIGATLLSPTARTQTPSPLTPVPIPDPVYATLEFADGKTVRIFVTNPETVQEMIDISTGAKPDRIPNGIIIDDRPGKSPYDPQWSWHFRPESIAMADVTIEVCDGTPSYIEENMDEWFQGNREARYCSWSAKVKKIEPFHYGDVTGDAKTDIADAQAAIRILIGAVQPNEAQIMAADLYPANGDLRPGDGRIDLRDIIHLVRRSAGLQ